MSESFLPPVVALLTANISQFSAKMATAKAEMTGVAGSAGTSTALAKTAFLGLAAGAAVVGAASLKMAGDFQAQTNVLVTAAGESAKSLGMVRKGILDISVATGTGWKNLTEGMYGIEKAGFRGAAGLQILKAAAQGAREENAHLATVANAMTSVMSSYNLKGGDAVRVMNALKTAAGGSKVTMEEFAGALSTVIPIAAANKISFAEIGGAIGTLTSHGTSANEATMELAATIRALTTIQGPARNAMEQLGLSVTDVSSHIGQRGLSGTIKLLTDTITAHMGPAGKVVISALKQSSTAANDLQVMMGAMEPKTRAVANAFLHNSISLHQFRTAIKGFTPDQAVLERQFGTADMKLKGFNDSLKSGNPAMATYQQYLAKVSGGAIGLNTVLQLSGGSVSGYHARIKAVAKSYNDASKNVEGWGSTQKLFNVRLAEAHQFVNRLAIQLGTALIPAVLKVADAVVGVTGFLERHKVILVGLAAFIGTILVPVLVGALVGALATVALNVVLLTGVLLANPLTWVALAVAALAVALYELATHWKTVWAFVKDTTKNVWDWLKGVFHEITAKVSEVWHSVARVTTEVWNGISGFFRRWWPLLLVIFLPAVAILLAVWNRFHTQIMAVVHTVWNAVRGFLVGVWDGIKSVATTTWDAIHRAVIDPCEKMLKGVTRIFTAVGDTITRLLREAWTAVKAVAASFFDVGKAIIEGILHGIASIGGKVLDAVKGVAKGALHAAKSFLGIASPSREFHLVGQAIAEGMAAGIHEHAHKAVRAAHKMSVDVNTEVRKVMAATGATWAEAAKHVPGALTPVQRAVEQIDAAHLRLAKSAEKAHERAAAAAEKAHRAAATAAMKAAEVAAVAMHDSMSKAIASMSQDLQGLQREADSFSKSMASAISGTVDLVKTFTEAQKNAQDPVSALTESLTTQLGKTKAFGDQLQQLTQQGASKELLQQIAQAGADAGGAMASALLAAGPASIKSITSLMASINTAGQTAAQAITASYFQHGIDSMTALIDGMKAKEATLQAEVDRVRAILAQLGSANAAVEAAGVNAANRHSAPVHSGSKAHGTTTAHHSVTVHAPVTVHGNLDNVTKSDLSTHLAQHTTKIVQELTVGRR